MKEGRYKILLHCWRIATKLAKNNPALEIFRKKGVEVLLFVRFVSPMVMSPLDEYQERKFRRSRVVFSLGSMETRREAEHTNKLEKTLSALKRFSKTLCEK